MAHHHMRKTRVLTHSFSSLVLLLIFSVTLVMPTALWSQSGAGSIQGTVQDATGAIIPNAALHVENTATGVVYDTTANASGFYTAPSLFAGTYSLTFTAPGMEKYQTTITLQVSQTALVSPKLAPGAVTETLVVEGGTAQLANYENGTISSTLDNQRINQLPENGRNILTLLQLSTPGLEAGGTRVNGLESAGVEYVQDGAPLSNRNSGGPTLQPDPDSVEEVRLETTNSNAEFAEPATAVVTT